MEQHSPSRQQATPKQTSAELLIHEILDDETGYDADVEVLRPDSYEEPDSEKSDDAASSIETEGRWRDDLVKYMKSLACNPEATTVFKEKDSSGGRKRRSKDAFGLPALEFSTPNSEGQKRVTEIADGQDSRPRPKRVRNRKGRSKSANELLHKRPGRQSEAGQFLDNNGEARTTRGVCYDRFAISKTRR